MMTKDGHMGLTSDVVRARPLNGGIAKHQFDTAFAALRKFNAAYTKAFCKRKLREERRARRAA